MDKRTKIIEAIKHNNYEEIIEGLEQLSVEELRQEDDEGQTLLHWAVFQNQLAIASILLSKGCDPNKKNKSMLSPFIASAANGLDDMFKLFLEYQPDLTETNRFGGSALLPSSEKGFIRVVQLALDAGVPVNHINRLGWSALLEASVLGDEGFLFRDIIEELIGFGANAEVKDFDGKSALDYIKEKKSDLILNLFKEGKEISQFTEIKQLIRSNQIVTAIRKLLAMKESLEQIYYLGFSYECLKQNEAAFYYYERGLKEDPQFAYYLANLAKKLGDQAKALAYFDIGANQSVNRDFFIYHKSNYLREIGKHPEAIAVMDELLLRNSDRVDYIFHKMNSLRALGENKAALELALQADRIQPENTLFKEQAEQIKNN